MWTGLENTYSGYLWESAGREGAVLRGWTLWYSRTQRLVVHFKRWRGENMLSDIKVTLKIQGICLIVCNFAAGHGSKEEQGFSHQWTKWVWLRNTDALAMWMQSSTPAFLRAWLIFLIKISHWWKCKWINKRFGINDALTFHRPGMLWLVARNLW